MSPRFRSSLAALLLAAGCSTQPSHSNPFDPHAPAEVQAKARLVGTVSVEKTGNVADDAGVRVLVVGLGPDTTTLADGTWTIAEVPPGTYTIEAFKDGYARAAIAGVVVELSSGGSDVEVPPLSLRRERGTLRGQATLESEETFAGIAVQLSSGGGVAQTDLEGRFILTGVPTGIYEVTFAKEGFRETRVGEVEVHADSATEMAPVALAANPGSISGRVLLRGAANNSGVIVTADGITLSGRRNVVQVTTTFDPSGEPPDGAFTLSNVVPGLYTVRFTHEDYVAASESVSVAPETEAILPVVELQRATGSVTGRATLERAADHAGIQVTLTPRESEANPEPGVAAVALTDSEGAWRVEAIPVGTYRIAYSRRPGYEGATGEVTVVRDAQVTAAAVELAELPGLVSGRVLLEGLDESADLSGTEVSIDGGPTHPTDAEGRFSLETRSGAHPVSFRRSGFRSGQRQLVTSPGEVRPLDDVTLVRSRGKVYGTLLVEGRPNDASGVLVTLSSATDGTFTALTDRLGGFRFNEVPVGQWALDASLASYVSIPTAQVSVVADADIEVPAATAPVESRTLTLRRDASLGGRVALELSLSPTTARVALVGLDINGADVEPAPQVPDATGAFRFDALPPGTYHVEATEPDYEPTLLGSVALSAGQSVSLSETTLARSRGDATGKILLAGSATHEEIRVTLTGTAPLAGVSYSGETASDGRFELTRLLVGTYDVRASKPPDWLPAYGTLVVARDGLGELIGSPLSLQVIASASVGGTVTVDKGEAIGTLVRLRGEDLRGQAVDLTQVSSSDGRFGFTNLVGGNYRLTYERANYETFDSTVFTVASGAAMNVPDVVLRIGRGEIAGSVRLAASAIPGFVLSDEKSGVVVTLRDENGAEVASTLTDASGSYRFSGVAVATVAGRHEVTATREHFAAAFAEVTVEANATTSVAEIVLQLQPGALAGHAYPNNGVNEQGRTENMGGVEISVSGVAYNGVPFNKAGASSAAADGSWIMAGLPPGTFEVHASSPNRRCQFKDGARPELSVFAGQTTTLGDTYAIDCYDTLAPGPLKLAATRAWTNETSFELAIDGEEGEAQDLTLPTSNLRGYQYVQGRLPDWSLAPEPEPGPFPFELTPNAENTLWVRAIDWSGNVGPATYVTVVHDGAAPEIPTVLTPRAYVNATTTSVSLTGAEGDPTFETYLACSDELEPAESCPPLPTCSPGPSSASFALSLTAGKRTCVWAQSRDLAGNTSAVSAPVSILCDLSRPAAPVIGPVYESSDFTVRAKSVDVFVKGYVLKDLPLGGALSPGKGIAYLEVDTGAGFVPLCPLCRHEEDPEVWDPCRSDCACDSMVQCATVQRLNGQTWEPHRELRSLRVPLVDGATNRISVRAVDLAGNVGDGASISVVAEGMRVFAQGAGTQSVPRFYKGSVAFADSGAVRYAPLDGRRMPTSPTCLIPSGNNDYLRTRSCESQSVAEVLAAPGELGLAVISTSSGMGRGFDVLKLLRPGAACPGGADTLKELRPADGEPWFFASVAASGKNLGWVEVGNWGTAVQDQKKVFTCQLDECIEKCGEACLPDEKRQFELGPAAGPGHMASLRAGGDYLLWAAEEETPCPMPKYIWRLTYVSRAPSWRPDSPYEAGDIVWASPPNGHAYLALQSGTSGSTPPSWPTDIDTSDASRTSWEGREFPDGEVRWRELSYAFVAQHATLSADGKLLLTADNAGALTWQASTEYSHLQTIHPTEDNGFVYVMWSSSGAFGNRGTSGPTEPLWPTEASATVVDGELTWVAVPAESMGREESNPPATYTVRGIGQDRLWGIGLDQPPGTGDDTSVSNVAIGEKVKGGLVIEAGRAAAISQTFDKAITVWDAAPDGTFVGDPTYLRHLVAKGGDPRLLELDQGLLVYAFGSDLVATDLSTLRWESAQEWEHNPLLADDGTIIFTRGGPERTLVARATDGTETAAALPGVDLDLGELGPVLAGKTLLIPVFPPASSSERPHLLGIYAGADGKFFTDGDLAPFKVELPGTHSVPVRLLAGGGNAVWIQEEGLEGQRVLAGYVLLQPTVGPATVVALGANVLTRYAGLAISEQFVVWQEPSEGGAAVMALKYIRGGALSPLQALHCGHFAELLGDTTWCEADSEGNAGPRWAGGIKQVLASKSKILVQLNVPGSVAPRLIVLDPGPDGRFGTGEAPEDDKVFEVPLGALAIENEAVAFGGDSVSFAASAPGLSAQLYTWRPESGAVLQRTFHFSEKRDVRMAPSGRVVWADSVFDSRSVFVWMP